MLRVLKNKFSIKKLVYPWRKYFEYSCLVKVVLM